MQDNKIEELRNELLSLTYTDLPLNTRNGNVRRNFSWLTKNINAFAHWESIKYKDFGYDVYREEQKDFDNGINIQYFRVITIEDKHRYNDQSFINTYANRLRSDLMFRYDINTNDTNRIKSLYKLINNAYGEAVRLKTLYDNSREYIIEHKEERIKNGSSFLHLRPSLNDWYGFEKNCLHKEVPTTAGGMRTSFGNDRIFNFNLPDNKVSHFNNDFFEDLTELFYCRSKVLELIINELTNTNPMRSKEDAQIFEELKNNSPKVYKITNQYFKNEDIEQIKALQEIIEEHNIKSLPLNWELIVNEQNGYYTYTIYSYYDNTMLFGFESDYKDLKVIFKSYTYFFAKQKESVLKQYDTLISEMPINYDFNDLQRRANAFSNWYIHKHIGNLGTTARINYGKDRISFEIEIDYSFFDRLDYTPKPLLRHLKEYFDSLNSEFNFVTVSNVQTNKTHKERNISSRGTEQEINETNHSILQTPSYALLSIEEKNKLIQKYNSITDFKEKLDFWFLNQSAMKFKGNEKSDLIEEYTQICQNDMGSTDRKSEILRIWEEEDFKQGIVEPVPTNDLEKEILVKKHIQIWGLDHQSIPTFEEYKINFNNAILNQLDKKWYAEKQLEIIKTDLDNQCKYETIIINHPIGKTPLELVYYMTNNNYKIDYPLIYNEYFNKHFYNSLVVRLAQIISKVQYQKFLETYFLNKEYENLSKAPATLPQQTKGFNLGYSVEQLTRLHKALINENYLTGAESDFINAFTGNPIQNKLEWIDIAERGKQKNCQTLFQLLHSLNIPLFKENSTIILKKIKDFINTNFEHTFSNLNQSGNEFIALKTERHKLISSIVKETLNLN
jgi:hypothetical protein